jgi:hypothetical protein
LIRAAQGRQPEETTQEVIWRLTKDAARDRIRA